jgi:hypothetical protein
MSQPTFRRVLSARNVSSLKLDIVMRCVATERSSGSLQYVSSVSRVRETGTSKSCVKRVKPSVNPSKDYIMVGKQLPALKYLGDTFMVNFNHSKE